MRIELDKAPPDRDIREIQGRLRDIAVVTRATLIGLGEHPRLFAPADFSVAQPAGG